MVVDRGILTARTAEREAGPGYHIPGATWRPGPKPNINLNIYQGRRIVGGPGGSGPYESGEIRSKGKRVGLCCGIEVILCNCHLKWALCLP